MALMQTDMDRPSWAQSFGFGLQGLLAGSWVVVRVPLRIPLKGPIGIL